CRARRIKCDEGRPYCQNCLKSRKICEGYGIRYSFRHTMGTNSNGIYGPVSYIQPTFMPGRVPQTSMHDPSSPLAHLGPVDPTQQFFLQEHMQHMSFVDASPDSRAPSMGLAGQHPHHMQQFYAQPAMDVDMMGVPPDMALQLQMEATMAANGMGLDSVPAHYHPQMTPPGMPSAMMQPGMSIARNGYFGEPIPENPTQVPSHLYAPAQQQSIAQAQQQPPQQPPSQPLVHQMPLPQTSIHPAQPSLQTPTHPPAPASISSADPPPHPHSHSHASADGDEHISGESFYLNSLDHSSSDMDEDYTFLRNDTALTKLAADEKAAMVQQLVQSQGGLNTPEYSTQLRTFSRYADDTNVLKNYTPSMKSSPLNDPNTAAVFWHFVNITGVSMSLYERHPFDHSRFAAEFEAIDEARQHAPPGQNIWSHTFPFISFTNPALMHAILALASLQISKLRGTPEISALHHYHISLRRIAHSLRSTNQRSNPATLAATLLLAYFEVWKSDHNKWCNHLFGASILFHELDLPRRTRVIIPIKRRRWLEQTTKRAAEMESQRDMQDPFDPYYAGGNDREELDPDLDELDTDFLGYMMGRHVIPEEVGQGPIRTTKSANEPTSRDIENYEHQRDLFFWYLKMNIYQSMLGGTKLFMDSDVFHQCPPRGPMGNPKAVYGTFDHLLLLLARVRHFASRDLSRKSKAAKLNKNGPSPPPMFNGMMPRDMKVQLPMGFSSPHGGMPADSPQSTSSEDVDLDEQTDAATREWQAILDAFAMFRQRLGPDFEPLAPEFTDRRESPFGPTLQYRTFSVAGIWMNYYMGLIHLHRSHPSMPPASMMAAGRAAGTTAEYARDIGRIAAGLSDDTSRVTEISTLLGGAFIESCFCLFVAGVQFQDQDQRAWLVLRMHDTTRLTGWGSARQIAEGCEAAWDKAANMGHGPRFQKPDMAHEGSNSRVWNNPRRLDRRFEELEDEKLVLVRSERAHYALGLLAVEEDMERLDLKDTMLP
ncbi:hypothetical protein TD95_003202, partial [Thielaviopsis punctulata]